MIPQLETAHIRAMIRLRDIYTTAEAQARLDRVDNVSVELSERMGTCAGRAYMRRTKESYRNLSVRLNARLLHINKDELIPTYLHELAHLVANMLWCKSIGHKREWKEVMAVLGVNDERCHTMNISAFAAPQKKFTYVCTKCDKKFKVSKVKHKRAQDKMESLGMYIFACPCKGLLAWEERLNYE